MKQQDSISSCCDDKKTALTAENGLSMRFLCVLTLIIVLLQIGFQRIAFFKMSIANQKSRIAFYKTRIANLKEGLQNSKRVCKRVVMSSFWDTCNRNPPLGFVSPNGGYVSCSPIIYITISSFDFKYMTSVITQILYLSFVNFNLHT